MRWWLLFALAGCRQLLGFEEPTVVVGDGPGPDGPTACESSSQCGGDQPVCGPENVCRGCVTHDECSSDACSPSGACADSAGVSYAAQGGTGLTCTQDDPCATIEQALAIGKPIVKLSGRFETTQLISIKESVVILAKPTTQIVSSANQTIVRIMNGVVEIYDVELGHNASGGGNGIEAVGTVRFTIDRCFINGNSGIGLVVDGQIAVVRHTVLNNNTGGGANLHAPLMTVTNSVFVRNGSNSVLSGGLVIDTEAGSVLFNTFADNVSVTPSTAGVLCASALAGANNIVTGNALDPNCTFDHSLFDANGIPGAGTNNRSGDPRFVTTASLDPRAFGFYRLGPGSAAIDAADPAATLADDIDGDSRPQGATRDIGADEFAP